MLAALKMVVGLLGAHHCVRQFPRSASPGQMRTPQGVCSSSPRVNLFISHVTAHRGIIGKKMADVMTNWDESGIWTLLGQIRPRAAIISLRTSG